MVKVNKTSIKIDYNSFYHHVKFESAGFVNIRMHANVLSSLTKSAKQQLFPLFQEILLKNSIGMLNLNCFIITSNLILIR